MKKISFIIQNKPPLLPNYLFGNNSFSRLETNCFAFKTLKRALFKHHIPLDNPTIHPIQVTGEITFVDEVKISPQNSILKRNKDNTLPLDNPDYYYPYNFSICYNGNSIIRNYISKKVKYFPLFTVILGE